MQRLNLIPNTPEWEHHRKSCFNASEAPMMMGCHRFKSRQAYLSAKVSGERDTPSDGQLYIFKKGHDAEAAARPLAESILGVSLPPVVGTYDDWPRLSASFDGLSKNNNLVWEHKLWSESLANDVKRRQLSDHYVYQLEQQLLVSGADVAVFMVSDGTDGKMAFFEYKPQPQLQEKLIRGWMAFEQEMIGAKQVLQDSRDKLADLEARYIACLERKKAAEADLDSVKREIETLADGHSLTGARISAYTAIHKGTIGYKGALAEIAPQADLEPYRGAERKVFTIRVKKDTA